MQSVGASRKVFEYIDRKPEIDTNGSYLPERLDGRIEFQQVHFAYPTRPDNHILRVSRLLNLNFNLKFRVFHLRLSRARWLPLLGPVAVENHHVLHSWRISTPPIVDAF